MYIDDKYVIDPHPQYPYNELGIRFQVQPTPKGWRQHMGVNTRKGIIGVHLKGWVPSLPSYAS